MLPWEQCECPESLEGRPGMPFICSPDNYRLPIGPIKVGRPRGANLGSMGNNRRHTVIMR
jgi:hypothetical protein